jgi:RHS repeat-associated protein
MKKYFIHFLFLAQALSLSEVALGGPGSAALLEAEKKVIENFRRDPYWSRSLPHFKEGAPVKGVRKGFNAGQPFPIDMYLDPVDTTRNSYGYLFNIDGDVSVGNGTLLHCNPVHVPTGDCTISSGLATAQGLDSGFDGSGNPLIIGFVNLEEDTSKYSGYVKSMSFTVSADVLPTAGQPILYFYFMKGRDPSTAVEVPASIVAGPAEHIITAPDGYSLQHWFTGADANTVTVSNIHQTILPTPQITLASVESSSGLTATVMATRLDTGGFATTEYQWTLVSPDGSSTSSSGASDTLTVNLSDEGTYSVSAKATDGMTLSPAASLDIVHSTMSPPSTPSAPDKHPVNEGDPCCTVAGGADPGTGNNATSDTLFSLPGQTEDTTISLTQSYTAAVGDSSAQSGLGINRQLGYETHLVQRSRGEIVWLDERGGPNGFSLQRDGSFKSPGGVKDKLVLLQDHYEIQRVNHSIYSFSNSGATFGKLTKIVDRNGGTSSFTYNAVGKIASVSAPLAGSVSFTYNSANLLTQVTRDRDNLTYSYTYDSASRLLSMTDFQGRTWSYTYVGAASSPVRGLLASTTDPLNRITRFIYDRQGRIIRKFEPGGGVWKYVYGNQSNSITSPNGATTKYFFDVNFREVKRILPDGAVVNTVWNSAGFMVSRGYELGGITRFGYDANGNLTSVQRPLDPSPVNTVYDQTFNKPILVTPLVGAPSQYALDGSGNVTEMSRAGVGGTLALTYTRDAFGNLLSVNNGLTTYSDQRNSNGLLTKKFDLHNSISYTYDSRNRVVGENYLSGRIIQRSFNDDDQPLTTTDSAGPATTNVYDLVGRLTQTSVSSGSEVHTTSFVYDDRDRLVSTTDALGRTTTNHYDPVHVIDKPSSVTDPAGRTTYFFYDSLQRLMKTTDALGATTSFTFDQNGNPTSVMDANGNVTRYAYDLNNRRIREDRPSVAGTTATRRVAEYFYDSADHLVREVTKSATGGQDRVIGYTYDSLDRLVRKTALRDGSDVPDDDSTFTYENQLDATLMRSAVNGVSSLSFTNETAPPFSSTGFVTAASQSGNPLGLITGTFALSRDVTGEIASVSKDGTTLFSKSYDQAARLTGVLAGSFSSALGYDGFGRRTSVQHSDGAVGAFGFDLLDRQVTASWTGPTPISEALTFDLAGNVTQLQREGGTSNISYDSLDQLISSTGLYSKTFAYDLLGNRLQDSANGPGSFVANFLASNGTTVFVADPNGFGDTVKETSGALVKNYYYRADDLLNAFQSGSTQVADYFDPLKRRVAKVVSLGGTSYTESFLHLGSEDRIIMAKAGDGTISTYLDGQGVDVHLAEVKSGVAKGYVADHLGSILNGDAAGSIHGFGLFGESATLTPSASQPATEYGFAGRELDESGLYYNRARNYSSETGRFLSQDKIGIAAGLNFYSYAGNSPVNTSDPSGNVRVATWILPAFAAACGLYDYYSGSGSIVTIRDLSKQIELIENKQALLRSIRNQPTCDAAGRNDADRQIGLLDVERLQLISDRGLAETKSGITGTVVSAICVGLVALNGQVK